MKKLLLISMIIGAMPLVMMAQDDDLYFVPKKKAKIEHVTDKDVLPKDTYYSTSNRSVDDYNRHFVSTVDPITGDSIINDSIVFMGEKGVYPDSLHEDFELTKKMSRFEDYKLADNAAFWAGYEAGRESWGWHSPWYYSRYGWYDGWYDPWYFTNWRYGWYDPWYYGYAGWYDPWFYPYYGYCYYGYYGFYGWGWGYPYYHHYYPNYVVVPGGGHRTPTIGTGTIRRDGSTNGRYGGYRGAVAGNSNRVSSMRDRATSLGGSRNVSSGNNVRSGSGNFSGYRGPGSSSRSSGSYSGSSSRSSSSGSFGGSRSSGSSFGGSSGSRSSGGGGGGSRLGGRR